MKKIFTIFLQAVILLIGIGMLAALVWEPQLEGRNVGATLFEIYFQDAFLAYIYAASIPFFVGLYQAFKLLGYARHNTILSHAAVNAVRTIKYCAAFIAVAIAGADTYIAIFRRPEDDPAGALMLGFITIFASIVIATTAAVSERILQDAVDIKSENDLTV